MFLDETVAVVAGSFCRELETNEERFRSGSVAAWLRHALSPCSPARDKEEVIHSGLKRKRLTENMSLSAIEWICDCVTHMHKHTVCSWCSMPSLGGPICCGHCL